MGYGASYLRGGDQEAQNWMQIAGMAKVLGNDFENDSASRGAAALMRGESLPEDMREGAKNKAYLEAPKLEEGAIIQRKNEIMKQAEEMAKSGNTTPHNILMNPSDDWFKDTIGYKAYASLARDVTDANLNSGKALASTQEINLRRFQDFDSKRTAVKDALGRGDFKAAASGLEVISHENPVPYKLSDFDEKTATFSVHAMDIDNGKMVETGERMPIADVFKQVSDINQQKYASGALLASLTAKGKNAESFGSPTRYKGKDGSLYTGVTLINPNTLTDTTIQLRDAAGKIVGSFNDPSKLADMGLTAYDQKFEKGELDIANEKKQGRNLDQSFSNLGADGILKRLSIEDKQDDMAYQKEIRPWQIEKTKNDALESGAKARGETSKEYNKNLDETFKVLTEAGIDPTPEISSLVRELPRNMAPAERAQFTKLIASKTEPIKDPAEKKKAIEDMVASAHGMPPEVYAVRRQFPNASPEELTGIIKTRAEQSRQKLAFDQQAKTQASAKKETDAMFGGITENFERIKNQISSSQYGMDQMTDDEIWAKAAQDPLFGKGLYDLRNTYFKDKKPEEMLGMIKQWYADKKTEESLQKQKNELSKTSSETEKDNRRSFYNFGR